MELILFFLNLLLIIGCHLWAGTHNGVLRECVTHLILFFIVFIGYICFIKYFHQDKEIFLGFNICILFVYSVFLFVLCKN
jgi:hypothetical protein